jgi:hypothetical protein
MEKLGIEDHMPAYDRRYSEIHDEKAAELESWSDERVAAELERYDAEAEEEFEEEMSEVPASWWLLFAAFFIGIDGIMFMLIAMIEAYWVGCGGFERV